MIKRPLHKRFNGPVKKGQKTTTIRAKPWPVGKPIMLYHWATEPYRSPQHDVAVIEVESVVPITIHHTLAGLMIFEYPNMDRKPALWFTEGFENEDALKDWFRPLVKRGETISQHLMTFGLASKPQAPETATADPLCSQLKDTIDDFFLVKNPGVDLAEAMVATGICTLGMITASVPTDEQQKVFECWISKMHEAWPRLRAITNVVPG